MHQIYQHENRLLNVRNITNNYQLTAKSCKDVMYCYKCQKIEDSLHQSDREEQKHPKKDNHKKFDQEYRYFYTMNNQIFAIVKSIV